MKQIMALVMFLILAVTAQADLSDYPDEFISGGRLAGQIVVGEFAPSTDALAATDIALSLSSETGPLTAYMDSEFTGRGGILIGLPCQNSAVAQVLETKTCNLGLSAGEGWIKHAEKDGVNYIIVSGATSADTRKAARLLSQYQNAEFFGDEARIGGTLDSPYILDAPALAIPEEEPECTLNSDCADNEKCSEESCTALECSEGFEATAHECKEVSVPAEEETQVNEIEEQETTADEETPEERENFVQKILAFFRSIFS